MQFLRAVRQVVTHTDALQLVQSDSDVEDDVDKTLRHPRLNRMPQTPARCACRNHAMAWRWSLADTRASVLYMLTPLQQWETAVLSVVHLTCFHLRLFK